MTAVFFGLGSNIQPEANLRAGVADLRHISDDILVSPIYLAPAFGFTGACFHNMVVGLETNASVEDLIRQARAIEDRHGRDRAMPRYSSRTLDIDLLLYGDTVCEKPTRLPRPDILQHAFVLQPLADIAGDIRHPTDKRLLKEIWESFGDGKPLQRVSDVPEGSL